jgi:RNA polymerase sigma-70 factor (ECF subfamily)
MAAVQFTPALLETLTRRARRLCNGDTDRANDLVSVVVSKAWEKRAMFQGGNAEAWMMTIMRNEGSNERRGLGRRQEVRNAVRTSDDGVRCEVEYADTASEDAEAAFYGQEVMAALEGINPEQAAVLRLLANEASYREISEALEIPMGTVMSRAKRGRKAMREALGR